jgi:sugar phosphate isomerase/epimerase
MQPTLWIWPNHAVSAKISRYHSTISDYQAHESIWRRSALLNRLTPNFTKEQDVKIGFPTHPRKNIIQEIQWIGDNGFDFVDLFLEADQAEAHQIDVQQTRKVLDKFGLDRIGHTAWYLPIGSPFKALRDKAVEIIKNYLDVFHTLACRQVTVHANWPSGLFTAEEGIAYQTESLAALADYAAKYRIKILYESLGSTLDSLENIGKILELNPQIDFHADIGHLNLCGRNPIQGLSAFKERLAHVHLHDNDGMRDLHLPLGTGTIDWKNLIGYLKSIYNDTITLEIFSNDKAYVLLSKQILESVWSAA